MRSDARKRLTEDEDPAVVAWREALGGEVKIITPVQWAEALAEAWDQGWNAARQVVQLNGVNVWAHTVFPEGYEGNPYRGA